MKYRIPCTVLLASFFAVPIYSVTIRHDVDNKIYINLARKSGLAAGLVVTRPFAETPGSGVLIHPKYVLTAGHVGSVEGPAEMPVEYKGKSYMVDHVYLFPAFKNSKENWGGYDLSILRLNGEGIRGLQPAVIWMKGIRPGQRIIGVGQGKSGTGKENDEPLPARKFRGYENTIDYIYDSKNYNLMAADFDSPEGSGNSLSNSLFYPERKTISGESSAEPLRFEGSPAAGDSGSGIWLEHEGKYYLAGIASFRMYSCYAGQGYYVNLSNGEIASWISSVCPDAKIVK